MNDTTDRSIATRHAPGNQVRLRLWQHRVSGDAAAGPLAVLNWLDAATSASRAEAERARHALSRQPWRLDVNDDGTLALHAGAQAWRLEPIPRARPAHWRVQRLHQA